MNITEAPSFQNLKNFIVYEGTLSSDSILFEGDFEQFADSVFSNPTWDSIKAWAYDNDYHVCIEGSIEFQHLHTMLAHGDANIDRYDADGGLSEAGIYDAGGHADMERYMEYADDLNDRIRDN